VPATRGSAHCTTNTGDGPLGCALKLAFPYLDDAPTRVDELGTNGLVPPLVGGKLEPPELPVRPREAGETIRTSVPETPMQEDGNSLAGESDIRSTRSITVVDPIAA
jgi:hypothetical protein